MDIGRLNYFRDEEGYVVNTAYGNPSETPTAYKLERAIIRECKKSLENKGSISELRLIGEKLKRKSKDDIIILLEMALNKEDDLDTLEIWLDSVKKNPIEVMNQIIKHYKSIHKN